MVDTLAKCEWIKRACRRVSIAGAGADKYAGGDRARHPIRHGGIPRYTLATKLVNELFEVADDNQLATTISRYDHQPLPPPAYVRPFQRLVSQVVARDGRVLTALARPGFPVIPKALALCPFNNALGRRPKRKSSASSSQQVRITERAGWI